jgi:MFS family permease
MKRLVNLVAPLRSRDFTLVWLGQSISQIGSACSGIALVWLLVGLTRSSTLMGVVLMASYIPTLLLLLFGGAIADRYDSRVVALVSDGLNALATVALAVLVTLGSITLVEVFAYSILSGLVSAFFGPALGALYPALTEPERYDAASSLRQMTTQFAILIGPALAGYLIARWSVGAALGVDAASFGISFLTLLALRARKARDARVASQRESVWRQSFAGFRFLRGEVGVLTLILMFSLTNGLNDVEAVLVPRLARLDLKLPATAFGLLASSMGAGALLGALGIGLIAPRLRRRAQVVCGAIVVFGGAIAAMGLARGALELSAAYAVMGATFAIPEVVFGALLQHIIPAEMRGRVYSLIGLIAMAMNPPGLLLAGVLGDAVGPCVGLMIGGAAISLLAAGALLLPSVRGLNTRIPVTVALAPESTPADAVEAWPRTRE